jgi:hypothetical protein
MSFTRILTAEWVHSAGANIVGSLFLGLFTRGLIAQAFICSAGNGVKISLPVSPVPSLDLTAIDNRRGITTN